MFVEQRVINNKKRSIAFAFIIFFLLGKRIDFFASVVVDHPQQVGTAVTWRGILWNIQWSGVYSMTTLYSMTTGTTEARLKYMPRFSLLIRLNCVEVRDRDKITA
jgi:hypothetical protein